MPTEAYHGLAGAIIEKLAPHTESDPVALLLQLLAYWGTVLGRKAFYTVEATRHYTNMFVGLVGPTSKGRKGTAYDHIEYYMRAIDASWTKRNKGGGCGSGEGLIYAVRDPVIQRVAKRAKSGSVSYEEQITDHGVIDKRYLLSESELTGVLKVCQRDGNILSEIFRQAWDHGDLHNTVKSNPYHATNAHISVIGHLTIDGLQRHLTSADMANGFGNRFLWPLVRRVQLLPDGGQLQKENVQKLIARLSEVFHQAKTVEEMRRDVEAREIWHAVYEPLSEGKPGLVGSLLGRGEAQVLRLSMLYALLDGSKLIGKDHLNAALAVWQYCEASARYIFGTASGDEDADTLLQALANVYPQGLDRKFIMNETFQGHLRADELDRIVSVLVKRQCITDTEVPREKGTGPGRPKHVYAALSRELSELSVLSETTYLSLSNDALKSMHLSSQPLRTNCELRSAEETETDNAGTEDEGSLATEPSPDAPGDPVAPDAPGDPGVPPYEPGPCINCQGTARWNDRGSLLCVVCWPPPAPQPAP